jgi:predicted RNase H-like HicB family nuclease
MDCLPVNGEQEMSSRRRFSCWAIIQPAEDIPGQWVAHCLDLDVVTFGSSIEQALKLLREATAMTICDDLNRGADPAERQAPQELWTPLYRILREGERFDTIAEVSHFIAGEALKPLIAVQLAIEVHRHEAVELPSPVPFFMFPDAHVAAC